MNLLINHDFCVKTFVHGLFAQWVRLTVLKASQHLDVLRKSTCKWLTYSCLCKLSWIGESISTYMGLKFLRKPFERTHSCWIHLLKSENRCVFLFPSVCVKMSEAHSKTRLKSLFALCMLSLGRAQSLNFG